MKILAVAVLLFVYNVRAGVIDTNCKGVIVHNINHDKEVLKEIENSPYQLAIDHDTKTLFFSFSNVKGGTLLNSAYLNLKTGDYSIVEGIKGGFANAVDSKTKTVYMGGNDGIYKFDYETKQAVHINGTTHNIWQLFYKNDLYYTTYPDEALYVFKDGKSERVPELKDTKVLLVAIDNNNNMYFSNSSGLFVYKKVKNYISFLGEYNLNGFTSDSTGNLYFSTPSGIYFIKDIHSEVELLASMIDVYGIAIELDGSLIIADYENIFRLKPTKKQCFSDGPLKL